MPLDPSKDVPSAAAQVDDAASQGTTSSSNSQTQDSKMDLAYNELRHTLEEAEKYRQGGGAHPLHIKLHVDALKEDIEMLGAFETQDDVLRLQAAQLVCTARRLRRALERDLIDTQIDLGNSTQTFGAAAVPAPSNASLKLTPLHLPTFAGEIGQFRLYRSFFEENILYNKEITDTGKWLRLKESLQGRPADLISEIPQSGETVEIAWKLLVDVYGGEDRPVVELYTKLQTLPPASLQTDSLRLTHSKLEGLLMSLEHLGHDAESNHFLRWTYLGKFPVEIMYQAQKSKDTPLKELRAVIGQIIAARECTDQQRGQKTPRHTDNPRRPGFLSPTNPSDVHAPSSNTPKKPSSFPKALKCVFCEGEHWNDSCDKYKTIETRKRKLTGRCFKCLRLTHTNAPCLTEKRCFHCDSLEHNRALCPMKFGESTTPLTVMAFDNESTSGHFLTFLARAKSTLVPNPVEIRILVDTAGGATLATDSLATQLQIRKTSESESYTGLTDAMPIKGYRLTEEIQLQTIDNSFIPIQAAAINSTIPVGPTANVDKLRQSNPQLREIYIPPTGEGRQIDLLIGTDTIIDILQPTNITAINADTLLLPTKFGALIVGRQRRQNLQVCHSHQLNFISNPLKQMTDLDLVGLTDITQSDVDDEEIAIKQFYETVRFTQNRYSISWPWRTYPPQLDTNFGLALGRLRSLYRKLQKLPDLLKEYHAIILRQLDDGIVEKVDNFVSDSPVTHYLPHHPVIQPGKSTSVRPVYDGSAKAKQKSLNDNIRKGTKWLTDLVSTLLRFRRQKTVVIADIAKAFHQISINDEDRDAARFLWLKNPDLPPTTDNLQIYRFTRVAFGIIASPFLLNAVIRHHANETTDKKFAEQILSDLYADNLVSALHSDIDPIEFYTYAKKFFGSMSMNLTKWATNDDRLRSFIPPTDRVDDLIQSILGIRWHIQKDTLTLKQPQIQLAAELTPRLVAKEMARWFDPLGWAAPITLLPKLFFRAIWDETKNWDKPLHTSRTEEWNTIITKLQNVQNIQLPRRYFTVENPLRFELHVFVDASASAYAIVAYLRTINEEKSQITIVAAKTRLTPKKTVTIPKLELIAILLGCKFVAYIRNAIQLQNLQSYLWSDSRCALAWMSQNKILPPIIEKYVAQAKKFNVNNMLYVPSEKNFADVATRGADYQLLNNMNWWSGPSWLNDEANWPAENQPTETPLPLLSFSTHVTCKINILSEEETQGIATLHIKNFSSLNALLKRTAFCFRALTRFKRENFLNLQTPIDTATALQWWIYWDQNRCYALPNEPDAGKKFFLHNIAVFRDNDGLLRCHTRIVNSVEDLDTVNPILLVKKSTLTKLIVLDIHIKNMHAGTSHTLASIRRKYWLPHGRRETYSIIHQHCFQCRRQIAESYPNPPAAPLPEFRITRTTQPFQAIGVDICGPFYIRLNTQHNKQKSKRWILLFTCAVIRAVHLEILHSMTTDEILMAFRRFFARRGVPRRIVSDNAPQFHVLDNCFKNIWHDLAQSNTISNYFSKNMVIWDFVPQLSPWMGGMYERLIQSVKLALEKTYGNLILLDRQFETTMYEIENVINSRPISYIDRELESPLLSPNDFLMAHFSAIPLKPNFQADDDTLKKLWRSSQAHLDTFWRNWSSHYLLLLRDRNDVLKHKRRNANMNPQKGDLVLMIDLSKSRSAWQLAVVERLIHSNDNQVRAAQIKIPNGSRLIRPISALAPINLIIDLPDVNDQQLNADRTAIIHSLPEDAAHSGENVAEEGETESEEEEPQIRIQRTEEIP